MRNISSQHVKARQWVTKPIRTRCRFVSIFLAVFLTVFFSVSAETAFAAKHDPMSIIFAIIDKIQQNPSP